MSDNFSRCGVEGCTEKIVIDSNHPAAHGARFTCKIHSGIDTQNDKLRFQSFRFDKDLDENIEDKVHRQ